MINIKKPSANLGLVLKEQSLSWSLASTRRNFIYDFDCCHVAAFKQQLKRLKNSYGIKNLITSVPQSEVFLSGGEVEVRESAVERIREQLMMSGLRVDVVQCPALAVQQFFVAVEGVMAVIVSVFNEINLIVFDGDKLVFTVCEPCDDEVPPMQMVKRLLRYYQACPGLPALSNLYVSGLDLRAQMLKDFSGVKIKPFVVNRVSGLSAELVLACCLSVQEFDDES